jgi:hypothetical protein
MLYTLCILESRRSILHCSGPFQESALAPTTDEYGPRPAEPPGPVSSRAELSNRLSIRLKLAILSISPSKYDSWRRFAD